MLYSLIRKYPIGNMCLRQLDKQNSRGAMREVVDGQQRLTTIYRFVNEGYIIQGDMAKRIAEYIIQYMGEVDDPDLAAIKQQLRSKATMTLVYDRLPAAIKGNITSYPLFFSTITNASDDEVAEYFRFLQNQERLRAGEIINSIPETALEKYLNAVNNLASLLEKISFFDDRREFDRIFYSIVGLLDRKIALGIADKDIIEYASEAENVSKENEPAVNRLIQQLNYLTNDSEVPAGFVNFKTKRVMKFFLLLLGFGYVDICSDTRSKLKALEKIDDQLAAFASAKANQIKETFEGYSSDVVDEYRLLAQISVRRQPYKRVKNRMSILAYYVNNSSNKATPSGIKPE